MTDRPLVSILMPAYNADKFIAEAIGSILDQDYPNWELLVLDDASSDNTREIINTLQDDRIKVFDHEENLGYLLSCNYLFEQAQGDFITFLDADDVSPANRISNCLGVFQSDLELDFVTTDHVRTDESGNALLERQASVDYDRYATDPNYYPTICCATIFLKTELLHKVGGYHPFFKEIGGEDYHWLFQLSRKGKGKHVSESTYFYRTHPQQIHLQNKNPLKYFAQDIDQEIREELLAGNDLLSESKLLREKWRSKIKKEPSELNFRKASEAINQKKTGSFLLFLMTGVFATPLRLKNVERGAYLVYSFLARIA